MNPFKILVVDDNVENAERIIDFLNDTEKSFTFFQALNGKMACAIAEKKLPDLIITDWEMPVMDGIELIKHLKSLESTKDIPIIMCTGVMTKTENLKTALDAGAVDYIRKPVEKLELTARVHSMLKLSDSMKRVKEQNLELLQQKEEIFAQKEEIETKKEKLSELNATKDKFFSIIAHDLKNPFHGILGLSDLIVNNKNSNETLQFAEMIQVSAKSAYKLLENLLEWSRAQTGKIEFKAENFALDILLHEIVGLLDNTAKAKNILITCEIPDFFIIHADRNMINTILRNLISNALKFTNKNGTVTIKAVQKSNEIEITVSDTGVGMSEKICSKLFKISEKVSTLGTEQEKGTGLGLLLCKEFVERHNGRIWVESQLTRGSDFIFTIPC